MSSGEEQNGWNEAEYMIKGRKHDDDTIANEEIISSDQDSLIKANVRDRFHFVQIVMVTLGICTLLPWNFFINANNYWLYKFRKVGSKIDYSDKTELQATFESYLSVTATVSLTTFLLIGIALSHRVRHEIRVYSSIIVITIFMAITTIFIKIDTDTWQKTFMAITLISVVILNAATAIFQGAVSGVASMLPPKYMNALMNGQSLGGVFASVANILTLTGHSSTSTSALAYFLIATFVCLVALSCYIFLHKSTFFLYYVKRNDNPVQHYAARQSVSTRQVAKKIYPYMVSAWFVLASTVSVFPAVLANSVSEDIGNKSKFTGVLYVPIVIFFLFNISDYTGRTISLWIQQPKFRHSGFYILVFLRVIFSILIIFCNRQPRHDLPILFHQDYWLIIFMILIGLTNGYFLTLTMMYAPMAVTKDEQELVGNMMAASAGTGVMVGTLIGMVLVHTV